MKIQRDKRWRRILSIFFSAISSPIAPAWCDDEDRLFESTFETRVRDVSSSIAHNCSWSRYMIFSRQFITKHSTVSMHRMTLRRIVEQTNALFLLSDEREVNLSLCSLNEKLIAIEWRLLHRCQSLFIFHSSSTTMFLFCLLILFLSNRITAHNRTYINVPSIHELILLPLNPQIEAIAAQFGQDPHWGRLDLPTPSDVDEPMSVGEESIEYPERPGVIKSGHTYFSRRLSSYPIEQEGVNPRTEHYVFFVRHGKCKHGLS